MSELSIWKALRAGGLTAAGAAAMMGNVQAESAMRSTNVQDCMGYTDDEYTRAVDNGRIDRESFATDQRGYGLCQWTYHTRKRMLFEFAVLYGASIGDEAMQTAFVLYEFPSEAPDTFALCCTSNDIYRCTEWICKYYERPAYNNITDRYNFAMQFFNRFKDEPVDNCGCADCEIPEPPTETVETAEITARVLKQGDKGRDVFLAQCGLNDMGYCVGVADGIFGQNTLSGVNDFKRAHNLPADGKVDQAVWQIMFQ